MFYTLPFSFKSFLLKKNQELYCSLEDSIRAHISLIIVSRLGSFRFDPEYGCEVWEEDFIAPSAPDIWKEQIKESLEAAIFKHEKRIEEITKFSTTFRELKNHKKMEFQIEGTIKGTNEQFSFIDALNFSPYLLPKKS